MRGSDVLKAIALRADAVVIGKLMAWSLAAGVDDALVRTITLLETGLGRIGTEIHV